MSKQLISLPSQRSIRTTCHISFEPAPQFHEFFFRPGSRASYFPLCHRDVQSSSLSNQWRNPATKSDDRSKFTFAAASRVCKREKCLPGPAEFNKTLANKAIGRQSTPPKYLSPTPVHPAMHFFPLLFHTRRSRAIRTHTVQLFLHANMHTCISEENDKICYRAGEPRGEEKIFAPRPNGYSRKPAAWMGKTYRIGQNCRTRLTKT